jgi:hypothetical protein
MQKSSRWAWAIGFFGSIAVANAQTPPPSAAGAAFDGTYRLVSSAPVSATYTTRKGQTGSCPSRRAGPLHIVNGQVRYTTATGLRVRGTVGPQGELAMQAQAPGQWGSNPIDLGVSGTVDGNGTVHVRQLSQSCSYDFVWQKVAR